MSRGVPEAVEFSEGGEVDQWDDVTCDRCGDLATRGYEGAGEMLNFCEGCYTDFGRWLK
jgi:hypothetical protein